MMTLRLKSWNQEVGRDRQTHHIHMRKDGNTLNNNERRISKFL